jgi:hypothetical protein
MTNLVVKDFEKIEDVIEHLTIIAKQVEQYDLEGNLINVFQSSKEANDKMGGKGNNVADCCRGRQKTAYGFIWKYQNEYK